MLQIPNYQSGQHFYFFFSLSLTYPFILPSHFQELFCHQRATVTLIKSHWIVLVLPLRTNSLAHLFFSYPHVAPAKLTILSDISRTRVIFEIGYMSWIFLDSFYVRFTLRQTTHPYLQYNPIVTGDTCPSSQLK